MVLLGKQLHHTVTRSQFAHGDTKHVLGKSYVRSNNHNRPYKLASFAHPASDDQEFICLVMMDMKVLM
jgi:hypothetical protein